MATISGISATSVYSINQTAYGATVSATPQPDNAPQAQASVVTKLSSQNDASSAAPLTYNASGLMAAFQQASANQVNTQTSARIEAQNAVLAAQNTITQTLDSLNSSASTETSGADISALLMQMSPSSSSLNASDTNGNSSAQNAVIDAQYAVSQALSSLGSRK